MNRRKGPALLLLAAAMTAALLAGCSGGSAAAASPAAPVSSEAFNLTVCLAPNPETIDPALNCAVDGGIMLEHFFEGLMKYKDDGQGNAVLTNGQAASYEKTSNSDGTVTYTFKLRDDIFWSDGKPVTAGDFVYAWRRLTDPATAASYCYILDMVAGAYEIMSGEAEPSALGVSAPDEATLVVSLAYDCPYFLEVCAFPALLPVRQDIIETCGDQWTFSPETYISNGIYRMTEWTQNARIVAVPNEYHYDAANLGPDFITFQFSDDESAVYSGFRAGELSFVESVPVDEIPSLKAEGSLKTVDYLGTYFICFQNQRDPFDDARVRQAFTLAVDNRYIADAITRTGETPATGFVPSGVNDAGGVSGDDFRTVGGDYWAVPVDDTAYQANCEKARELLSEAGYPDGEGFPAVEYLYNTDDRNRLIAEALQSMWAAELGVTVKLANQDWAAVLQTCFDGEYDMACGVWIADYNDPISFLDMWYTDGGNNIARYSSPDFDAAIDRAKSTADPAERMAAMHEAEDILIGRDWVIGPIYFYSQCYCIDPGLKGVYYSPLGYFYFGYTSMAE